MTARPLFLLLVISIIQAQRALAQPAVSMVDEPYRLESGIQSNNGEGFVIVSLGVVHSPQPGWMRVRFEDSNLGEMSYIVLKSMPDAQQQTFDGPTLAVWSNVSAAFRGDVVEVVLHVAPGEKGIYANVTGITVPVLEAGGESSEEPDVRSLCGTDDRLPGGGPVGRLGGCTGWLVSNGAVLTAGHCGVAVGQVIEFNVPQSTTNGGIVGANVADQFPVTAVWGIQDNGVGQDWQVLRLGPNVSNPAIPTRAHVQHEFFRMTDGLPPNGSTLTVTGFGLDNTPAGTGGMGAGCCDPDGNGPAPCSFACNSNSQTNQTATGAYAGLSGSSHTYAVDTMPANSGSPIIWGSVAIGIHTTGGCTGAGGSNSGTSFALTALKNSLESFPGAGAVFVDSVAGLPHNGGIYEPYKNLPQAVAGVTSGGIISVVEGSYPAAAGNTFVAGADGKAMTIEAPVGTVTIGN